MIHSDAENVRWWKGLTKRDQDDLLDLIWSKAASEHLQSAVLRIKDMQPTSLGPSPKDLALVRKWYRR